MRPSLALTLLLLPALAHGRAGPGSTTANFLKIGVSARAVAMGEAFTGLADDVNAIFYNPAGLGMLTRQELSLMHNQFFEGVTQEWGAYAWPTRRFGTFAGSFNLVRVAPFPSYDENDFPTGEVDAQDMAATLSYAKEFAGRRLSVGGSGKYIQSELAGYRASVVAFDVGALALYGREGKYETGWRLGASIRNIGQEMRFLEKAFPLPQSLHIGVSRDAPLPHPFADMRWKFSGEAVLPNDRLPYVLTGFELRFVPEFAIRAGWRQNQDSGLGLSAGLGFASLNRGFLVAWFPEVSMDYAFVDFGKLDHTHRLSLTIRFGHNKNSTVEYESLFEPTQ